MHHQTLLSQLEHPLFTEKKIDVWIKRDDLNHPAIQGNKWHKLKLNLEAAKRKNRTTLVTFGGAYSNHLAATAAAGKAYGFETNGYVRGDELENHSENWSSTLIDAQQNGMQLHFLSREAYRQKHSSEFLTSLTSLHPNAYILPEGGTNELAIKGFAELCNDLENQCPNWTHLLTAVGTGGTLTGFISNTDFQQNREILGISTLKNAEYLKEDIETWLCSSNTSQRYNSWQLLQNYHGGGYAKSTAEMRTTQAWFEKKFDLLLDPIYTQKMIYAFLSELKQDRFPPGSNVILYHSGGLQGR
ncbi:1-aminocyclopropane-1-carboxylate deaminase/D-cysteine desulfhydrase [Hydrogenovibrio kuenenii]|uniref:1-aminocyclopropane-1-carboxylate deaminase/D-cysteine desulfhydrase n=1 Tax=Hydrogenovibrio kuenenii TaxID=63658 RepID=UPI00046495BE|nr:pyridoxal-phosphate dependent enzyme [Hydrogenovibrio kuenenii]